VRRILANRYLLALLVITAIAAEFGLASASHPAALASPRTPAPARAAVSAAVRACPSPGSSGVVSSHIGSSHPCSVMAEPTMALNFSRSSSLTGFRITAARLTAGRRGIGPSGPQQSWLAAYVMRTGRLGLLPGLGHACGPRVTGPGMSASQPLTSRA